MLGFGRDPLAPQRDAITADGEMVIPLGVEALGLWLKAAFGNPVTTGTTPKVSVATQLLRIMLFSFFSFLAAKGIGVWDANVVTLTLQVDSVVALVDGVGGHLATLGWWRRASSMRSQ